MSTEDFQDYPSKGMETKAQKVMIKNIRNQVNQLEWRQGAAGLLMGPPNH